MIRTRLDPTAVKTVATWLAEARGALFITGAGISAESGLPTYRGIGGLYDGVGTDEGMPIEVALSGATMRDRPDITWKYLSEVERACRGARFNRAHELLAAFEREIGRAVVLTQNVDGFHTDAGHQAVIEIHGNLRHLQCQDCGFEWEVPSYEGLELPPICPMCRGQARPRVVLFGETLPVDAVAEYERQLREGFDVVVAIGTTALFPYIAHPVLMARTAGIPTVEINPGTSAISGVVDVRLAAGAVEALEAVWAAYSSSV